MRIGRGKIPSHVQETRPRLGQVPRLAAIRQRADHDMPVHVTVRSVAEALGHPQTDLMGCHAATGIEAQPDMDRVGCGDPSSTFRDRSLTMSRHEGPVDVPFMFSLLPRLSRGSRWNLPASSRERAGNDPAAASVDVAGKANPVQKVEAYRLLCSGYGLWMNTSARSNPLRQTVFATDLPAQGFA